jgi:hypothetical protein
VNTKALARHYGVLTPEERLPLIMAASVRGDETEYGRLMHSAPKVSYRVPDYFGHGVALSDVSHITFMELLDTAALFLRCFASGDHMDEEHGERMFDAARAFGFVLKTKLAGWRAFCRDHGFDAEALWKMLPGRGTVADAERLAADVAFTAEGIIAYFKRLRDEEPGTMISAESFARGLNECFSARLEFWS